ncbi:MAG: DUF2723 domain-containing protein [Saprospiraceae bacterium]
MSTKFNKTNLVGWIVFILVFTVYYFSVERSGSLWDCGEFVLGAYKLQVVHPPGAPLFLIIGRLFAWIASVFSDNPSYIAFGVNLMSAACSALAATFVCWITMMFGRLSMYGRDYQNEGNEGWAMLGSGLVAGLSTGFISTTWFSAVEGEVYSMSTMFTTMTFWAAMKWYYLEDNPKNDKWLIFAIFATGLSTGVHLLSLLAFPTIAALYYFKRYKTHTWLGMIGAMLVGVLAIFLFQILIIIGIPDLWSFFEKICVNSFGLPFHTGLIPTLIVITLAGYYGLRYFKSKGNDLMHKVVFTFILLVVSYSTVGVVLIRAIAKTPVNMNDPYDVMRLIPYLNREQYGDRSLLKGPHFDARPIDTKSEDRWGRVGNEYKVVDQKYDYEFREKDKILFPRISHSDQGRPQLYRTWMEYLQGGKTGVPTMAFNLKFMWSYQFGWMYWRYFMWNFVGRQNAEQGFFPWINKDGHWYSGIKPFDSGRLYNQDHLPRVIREDQSRNSYYFLPFILGILGVVFHFKKNRNDFLALVSFFILTGIALCVFNNSPPNEPRERDYVLEGSFLTFCMWIGMGVLFLSNFLTQRFKLSSSISGISSAAFGLVIPILLVTQNFDDHSRMKSTAARDYASNILESCQPNSILFTYGDNDTYPVWYAQEVEGIRRDVRVINLSLIAVDWYIENQRRKFNESAAVKMSIPQEKLRGSLRNQIFYYNPENPDGTGADREMSATEFLKYLGEDHPVESGNGRKFETHMPTRNVYFSIDRQKAFSTGLCNPADSAFVDKIPISINAGYITKDDLAVIDIINSNIYDRPIYFSVTCNGEKLMGLDDYTNQEGMALRVVPIKTKSDPSLYIYGAGRADLDKTYDIIMNKYRWGNFDKVQQFVDHSFAPSIQAMRMIMMRTAVGLQVIGDKDRAIKIANKYFEAFPNMNFQYDVRIMPFIQILIESGDLESAKKQLRTLATETVDMLQFFDSLTLEDLNKGFAQDKSLSMSAVREIIDRSKLINDPAFLKEMETLLNKYNAATPNLIN